MTSPIFPIILVFTFASLGSAMKKNNQDDPFGDFFADFQKKVQMQQAQQDAFFKNSGFGNFGDFGSMPGGTSRRVEMSTDKNGNVIKKVFVNGKEVSVDDQDVAELDDGKIMNMFSPTMMSKAHVHKTDFDDAPINPNKIIIDRMGCASSNQKKVPQTDNTQKAPTKQVPQGGNQGSGDLMRQAADATFLLLKKYRSDKRLGAVQHDEEIYDLCLGHSQMMASKNFLTHNGFSDRINALSYSVRAQAENVAMFGMPISDPTQIAAQFMDQWKKSPGHNANMLNPAVNRASVAVAKNGGAFYATMILVEKS